MPRPYEEGCFGIPNLAKVIRDVTGKSHLDSLNLATEIIKIMIQGLKEDGEIRFKNFCSIRIVDIEPGDIKVMGKMRKKKLKKAKATFSRAFRKAIDKS